MNPELVELLANVATAGATLLALAALILELRRARQERELTIFFRYLDHYSELLDRRRTRWREIREVLSKNEKTKDEITGRTSSLDYLVLRAGQTEPFYPAEHEVLDGEIRSLNVLNELCVLVRGDGHREALLGSFFASDISYYQNRLDDLLKIRERESRQRLFPIPRFDAVKAFPVTKFFPAPPGASRSS